MTLVHFIHGLLSEELGPFRLGADLVFLVVIIDDLLLVAGLHLDLGHLLRGVATFG